jgi:hypothetical protein
LVSLILELYNLSYGFYKFSMNWQPAQTRSKPVSPDLNRSDRIQTGPSTRVAWPRSARPWPSTVRPCVVSAHGGALAGGRRQLAGAASGTLNAAHRKRVNGERWRRRRSGEVVTAMWGTRSKTGGLRSFTRSRRCHTRF